MSLHLKAVAVFLARGKVGDTVAPPRSPAADARRSALLSSLPPLEGTKWEKIRIQKWYTIYKDHITLEDYEIHDGMGLELYYN